MVAYVKTTDFAVKDSLLSGNPAKIVKGTEIDTEFNNIALADVDNLKSTAIGVSVAPYDANMIAWPAAVSATEVGYLDGVTSAIQTQLGAKAGTAGNTFTGAQILSDQQVSRAMLLDCGYTVVDKGNSGTTTQTYDYTAGSVQTSTCTGAHTIAFSNWPPTGNLGELLVILTNGGSSTITWPAAINWIKPDGTTTTSITTYLAANTGRTALQTSGVDQFVFWTRDAGTTIYGRLV